MMQLMTRRCLLALVAATAFLTAGWTDALADDRVVAHTRSPDKKWEIRRTDIDAAAANNGVESDRAIVRAGTTKPLVELPLHVGGSDAADDETTVAWAPDSKRFAYNFRAGGRYESCVVYQLRNGRWKELRSLESKQTSAPLDRVQAAQLAALKLPDDTYRRRIWDTWQVTRWKNAETAELYVHSEESVIVKQADEEQLESLAAYFLFMIRFDENGKWKIAAAHEMSPEEVAARDAAAESGHKAED
jgi:hypothetical protein